MNVLFLVLYFETLLCVSSSGIYEMKNFVDS